MKIDSKLANAIAKGDFIVTAEILPGAGGDGLAAEAAVKAWARGLWQSTWRTTAII